MKLQSHKASGCLNQPDRHALLHHQRRNSTACASRPRVQRRRCTLKVKASADDVVVIGDIGGTNARLTLWKTDTEFNDHEEIFSKTYPTTLFSDFDGAMEQFLNEKKMQGHEPKAAALAVAGAVENNRCAMTNTKWVIDGFMLEKQFNFKVAVLNDFEAVGYGIPAMKREDLYPLNDVPTVPQAPIAVMGPGTGLGAAQLFWDSGLQNYRVWPGEGAHATFAPRGWRQRALMSWVTKRFGHCEIEEVACGRGLELIYEFLISDEVYHRPDNLPAVPKTAPEITSSALQKSDQIAVEAVDIFMAIVGAEAGAMALRSLTRGGVYICGGIIPRLLDRVNNGALYEAFVNAKGRERFHNILKTIPLFVVTNTKVGIIGSREYAIRLMKDVPC